MNTHLREPLKKAHLVSGVQSNGLRIPFPCSHTGERDDTIQKGKKLFLPTAHPSRGFWGVKMSRPQLWDQKQGLDAFSGSWADLILVAKSKSPSQAACFMTRLKGEVRVCSGASPRSQLIN